jgi:hypothetical protein
MTARHDFDGMISDWLDEAGRGAPDYLDEILARTTRTRQRPAWSSLERWLPVQLTYSGRTRPIPRFSMAVVLLVVLALLAAALLLAGVGQKRLPRFGSTANGAIAFVDGGNLKLAAPDGSNIRVAVALPSGVESLTFSPDGTHLAYRTTGTPASIVVADADGSHPVVITGDLAVAPSEQLAVVGPFAWSPDGRQVAFTWLSDTQRRSIAVVDADGSHLRQLTEDPAAAPYDRFDPAWSPDGQWISYFTDLTGKGVTGKSEIYITLTHPDGSDTHVLGDWRIDPLDVEMSWSPDPAHLLLAFAFGTGPKGGGVIVVYDMATSKAWTAGGGYWITWSPDGKHIAWWGTGTEIAATAEVLAGGNGETLLLTPILGGTCALKYLVGKAICGPAQWSPDSKVIFGTDTSGTVIVFATIDGSAPIRTLSLEHPVDLTNGPNGSIAWQAVAP